MGKSKNQKRSVTGVFFFGQLSSEEEAHAHTQRPQRPSKHLSNKITKKITSSINFTNMLFLPLLLFLGAVISTAVLGINVCDRYNLPYNLPTLPPNQMLPDQCNQAFEKPFDGRCYT